jgi:hypothetical protein
MSIRPLAVLALTSATLALSAAPALAKHHKHHHKAAAGALKTCPFGQLRESAFNGNLTQKGTTCATAQAVAAASGSAAGADFTAYGFSCTSVAGSFKIYGGPDAGGSESEAEYTCTDAAAEIKFNIAGQS